MSIAMKTSDLFDVVLRRMGRTPVWLDVKGE